MIICFLVENTKLILIYKIEIQDLVSPSASMVSWIMSQLRRIFVSRTSDVLSSNAETVLSNLKIFFNFANSNLITKTVLEELMKDLPNPETVLTQMKQKRRILLPSTYLEKVKTCLSILLFWIEKSQVFTTYFNSNVFLSGLTINA